MPQFRKDHSNYKQFYGHYQDTMYQVYNLQSRSNIRVTFFGFEKIGREDECVQNDLFNLLLYRLDQNATRIKQNIGNESY